MDNSETAKGIQMQQKGVNRWAACTARSWNKTNLCMVRHCPILFSWFILEHEGIHNMRWIGKVKQWQSSRWNALLSHFISHSKPCAPWNSVFCSIRKIMLEGGQLTSGAGPWDNSLLYLCTHALIQPRWGKLCKGEVLKLAEPSSWVKNGVHHLMKRRSSFHFLGLIWLVKEVGKKMQGHFFP